MLPGLSQGWSYHGFCEVMIQSCPSSAINENLVFLSFIKSGQVQWHINVLYNSKWLIFVKLTGNADPSIKYHKHVMALIPLLKRHSAK